MTNCFDFSGNVPSRDLQDPNWKAIFAKLEAAQSRFLDFEPEFRSPNYKWPKDALHNWSRVWEYPFVYHHLAEWAKNSSSSLAPKVVYDLGSGVTFFPWAIAELGFKVTCLDVDPVCATDIPRADQVLRKAGVAKNGLVDFRLITEDRLPCADQSADAVYCISVLEHIPNHHHTVREIARVLKPGGLFVLTVDLDLRGDQEISPEGLHSLQKEVEKHFQPKLSHRDIAQHELLTSINSPWGFQKLSSAAHAVSYLKQRIIKPILGRKPGHVHPYHLAVNAGVYTRRS